MHHQSHTGHKVHDVAGFMKLLKDVAPTKISIVRMYIHCTPVGCVWDTAVDLAIIIVHNMCRATCIIYSTMKVLDTAHCTCTCT